MSVIFYFVLIFFNILVVLENQGFFGHQNALLHSQHLYNSLSFLLIMRITKITIVNKQSIPENVNDLLLTFGHSLGLFSLRDKDKSCYRIFIVLVKALKMNVELTSDELALQTGLSRGTIIHHLNHLMSTGIVTNYKNRYFIPVNSLSELVDEMRSTVNELFDNIAVLAKRIDGDLDIK